MLFKLPVPTLAVTDLDKAKSFYGETLGLEEIRTSTSAGSDALYRVGDGHLYVYERPEHSASGATVCSLEVEDVEATVEKLRERGITFEEYNLPEMGLETKNGVATLGEIKSAWFKDPFGNILAIGDAMNVLSKQRQPAQV